MDELRSKLLEIQEEKNTKLLPENLRVGVTCLGIEGTFTSDADATATDIVTGKIAYVNGEKVEGTVNEIRPYATLAPFGASINLFTNSETNNLALMSRITNNTLLRPNSEISMTVPYADIAADMGITSDMIVQGNTILGVAGTGTVGVDTSDATATEYDIAPGVTAYTADGLVYGRMNVAEGMSYDSEYSKDKTEYRMFYDEYDHKVKMIFRDDIKVLLVEGTEIETRMLASDIAQAIGLTSDQIVKGNTVLDVEGTYQPSAVTFATVEEMNNNTTYPENTLAVVYGTEYVGTYKLDSGVWTQIGDRNDGAEMMKILNETDNNILEYEGNGGTDDEINAVLEDILTNPNTSEEGFNPELPDDDFSPGENEAPEF